MSGAATTVSGPTVASVVRKPSVASTRNRTALPEAISAVSKVNSLDDELTSIGNHFAPPSEL
jgi:hypothetical protein